MIEIYQLYYGELYNYGIRISRNDDLTRDCIHDLFVQLWSARSRIAQTREPKPYIFKMLRFMIIDALKQQNMAVYKTDHDLYDPVLSGEDIIIGKEISTERSNHLKKAIQQLTNRQKEIIYLRFYSGLSYEEISEVTALKYQSIRNLFSNALKELRKVLLKDTLV